MIRRSDALIIPESKCPLCGKMLTNEEYINVKNELKNQVSEEHKKEIQQLHEVHREEIKLLQKDLQGWYSKEIEDLKKSHEEDITKMKEYLKSEQERCMNIYRQEASEPSGPFNLPNPSNVFFAFFQFKLDLYREPWHFLHLPLSDVLSDLGYLVQRRCILDILVPLPGGLLLLYH